jgi:2-C-methyl-D-erythritol 4-phosphate cytidylyltransferase
MTTFSIVIVTANPPGLGLESNGSSIKIEGREAIVRTVELFLNRDNVKQIQAVFLPDDLEEAKRKHGGHFGFSGVKVVSGGPRPLDQCIAAAAKLDPAVTHVILHDAARPAVPYADIDALMEEAERHPAVSLVTPCRSTLVELDEGGSPMAFHPASQYMQMLMPQSFTREKFLEFTSSRKEPHASQFSILRGSPLNIRINNSADAPLARAMISMLPKPKAKPLSNPFEEAQW